MYNMQTLSPSLSLPLGGGMQRQLRPRAVSKTVGGKSRCSEIHRLSGKEGEGLLVRWLLFSTPAHIILHLSCPAMDFCRSFGIYKMLKAFSTAMPIEDLQ